MNADDSGASIREERLAAVILEYMDAREAGRSVDRTQFMAEHADFQEELRQFFANHDRMERVAEPIRDSAGERSRTFDWAGLGLDEIGSPRSDECSSESLRPLGQLGEFRLLRELGRGGMGIVYEAEQHSLQRHVALKVLPFAAAVDAKLIKRFRNEALAAAMLNHPNIVPVYSVGTERGVHFYAMQLIEGQSLAALISGLRHQAEISGEGTGGRPVAPRAPADGEPNGTDELLQGPHLAETDPALGSHEDTDSQFRRDLSSQHVRRDDLFFRTAARLILQAAEALQHAHESGIVHRDIKPANLLVDMVGQLRITDFGLAQFHSQIGVTRTGDTPGTLRYMSPEQAAGKRLMVDHRTDVYSLGATFYELLSVCPIFKGNDVQELLSQIFNTQPTPLRQLDRSIPVELETIVLKATQKSPEDRYATAADLAADLRRYLANQPILARRPSVVDRARMWSRRHPSVVVASLVVMAFVSAVACTSIFLVERAYQRERLRADEAEAQYLVARRSVDELVRVSEEELAFNPAAESVRRRLLTSVLSYYEEFIKQRLQDSDAQESLAEARSRVEKILNGLRALRAAGQIKLLNQEVVAKELRLSETQRESAKDLLARVESLWHGMFREIGQISAAELDRRFVEQSRLNEADLKATLTPDQLRRLYQLDLQADVAAAFREPEVSSRLRLSDSQRDRVKTIEQQEMAQWRTAKQSHPAFKGGDDSPSPKPATSKNERILGVLTEEQAVAWRELTGPPLADLRR